MSSHLCSVSENYKQVTGEISQENYIVMSTRGVSQFSFIAEALNVNDEPVNFDSQFYEIHVRHEYNPPEASDANSYFNVMLNPDNEKWIFLRKVSCGTGIRVDNSWTENNIASEGNILHFTFVRLKINGIPDVKTRLTVAAR